MERMEAPKCYYTTHNKDARLISKHGMVEFLTTVRYVEQYLEYGMRILEIGAGISRYSHYFVRNGYDEPFYCQCGERNERDDIRYVYEVSFLYLRA